MKKYRFFLRYACFALLAAVIMLGGCGNDPNGFSVEIGGWKRIVFWQDVVESNVQRSRIEAIAFEETIPEISFVVPPGSGYTRVSE